MEKKTNLDNQNSPICRVCLQTGDMISLFKSFKGSSPYEYLIRFTKLNNRPQDGSPCVICTKCLIELEVTVNFLNKCERANNILSGIKDAEDTDHWYSGPDSPALEPKVNGFAHQNSYKLNYSDSIHNDINDETLLSAKSLDRFSTNKSHKKHQYPKVRSKIFHCDLCDKHFHKKDNLLVHRKRHGNEREWSCGKCGMRHYTSGELQMHLRTHSGERPYACNTCQKRFTARNNLLIHQRTHTGERPHACEICGKTFISSNILTIHRRIHTGEKPYVCSVCGKQFANNKLAAHMRTHTGDKPYACTVCGGSFSSSHSLAVHKRRHTGVKPYSCNLCGQNYGHTQSLNKHMKRHHSQNKQEININKQMVVLLFVLASAVCNGEEKKTEKRGVLGLGLGYGHGLYGHGLYDQGLPLYGHGVYGGHGLYGGAAGLYGHGLYGPGLYGHAGGLYGSPYLSKGYYGAAPLLGLGHGLGYLH